MHYCSYITGALATSEEQQTFQSETTNWLLTRRFFNGIWYNQIDHVAKVQVLVSHPLFGTVRQFEKFALTTFITSRVCAPKPPLHLLLKWPSFSSGINKVDFISTCEISHNTSITLQCQIAGGGSADIITSQYHFQGVTAPGVPPPPS